MYRIGETELAGNKTIVINHIETGNQVSLIPGYGGAINTFIVNGRHILKGAIEADDFTKLPSISYAKGFVKNYSDFLGEEKFTSNNRQNPILYPGDMILIPGISKSALRENLMFILSILGTLTSIAVLIVTVFKK